MSYNYNKKYYCNSDFDYFNNMYYNSQNLGFTNGYNQAIYDKCYNLGYQYALTYNTQPYLVPYFYQNLNYNFNTYSNETNSEASKPAFNRKFNYAAKPFLNKNNVNKKNSNNNIFLKKNNKSVPLEKTEQYPFLPKLNKKTQTNQSFFSQNKINKITPLDINAKNVPLPKRELPPPPNPHKEPKSIFKEYKLFDYDKSESETESDFSFDFKSPVNKSRKFEKTLKLESPTLKTDLPAAEKKNIFKWSDELFSDDDLI